MKFAIVHLMGCDEDYLIKFFNTKEDLCNYVASEGLHHYDYSIIQGDLSLLKSDSMQHPWPYLLKLAKSRL